MTPAIIVVGASAGGVNAIQELLKALEREPSAPIAIVQHIPATANLDLDLIFGRSFKGELLEAVDKMPIERGKIYFAPPGYHLLVEREGYFSLSQDEPVHFSRPSIDVLFESAVWAYGHRACGVILTGANADGAAGLRAIGNAGGETIVQDPEEAEAPTMPRAAIAARPPKHVLPIQGIAALLSEMGRHS